MDEDSFYITLPSNVKVESSGAVVEDSKNSLTSWKTDLHSWIHLEGEYEVGLAEFSYTYSWFNINTPQEIWLTLSDGTYLFNEVKYITPGFHNNIQTLCSQIQQLIFEISDIEWNRQPTLRVSQHGLSLKIAPGEVFRGGKLKAGTLIHLKFGDELAGILGLPLFKPSGFVMMDTGAKTFYDTVSPPQYMKELLPMSESFQYDLTAGIHSLFVYTDIIKHRFVGNAKAQLLRKVEIPPNLKYGDQVNITFERPHYHPIITPSLCSIEIAIRDDTDTPISFQFGRCFAVLHFKKRKNYE